MLLTQPEFHHEALCQQFCAYMADIDIETVDGDVSAAVCV